MDRSKVAIIIPAFNEEDTISNVVRASTKFGTAIVIDDGSTDNTAEKAKKIGAIVISHKINQGYDIALDTGFKKASKLKYNYIITLDADGQHEPKLLQKFIDVLDAGVFIVIGVRNKKARLAEYLFGLYTNYRYGIIDPLCGLKAYRFNNYNPKKYFGTYKSIGTELMLRSISTGKKYEQIYFKVKERQGKTRFGNSFLANLKILRSLFYCMLKKY